MKPMLDKNGIDLTQWRPIDRSEKLKEGDRVFHEYGFIEVEAILWAKNPPESHDYYRKIPFISEYGSASAPLPPARFSYRDWLIGQVVSGVLANQYRILNEDTAKDIIKFADEIISKKDKNGTS